MIDLHYESDDDDDDDVGGGVDLSSTLDTISEKCLEYYLLSICVVCTRRILYKLILVVNNNNDALT